ncbi:hypothetical protein [Oryzisolibacter sp. LB2S]|uniref:hypothetical protein n=1 Tax=Alicycliphilus soli TaxID=3228789 RepID=UPI003457BEE4
MRSSLALLASAVVLTACGGGGGGDSADINISPSAAPATLTTENYVAVAQKTLSSNAFLLDSASLVTGAQVSDPQLLMRFAREQMSHVPAWFAQTSAQAVGVVQTDTENCPGGGTLTLSLDDRNGNDEADAGDSVTVTANNCTYEDAKLNGRLKLTVQSVQGNPESYPFSMKAALEFSALSAQSAQATHTGDGSLDLTISIKSYNAHSVALATPSFTLTSTYGGSTTTETLRDYEASLDADASGYVTSVQGMLLSSALDSKSVTIATTTPFRRTHAQPNPASGSAVISGAAGAKVRVTAIDTTSVKIELDADGDGAYEKATPMSWSEVL